MKINKKKILFSFLLFTLMIVKVSALHVYFHCEDSNVSIENCTTCDLAIKQQQVQFTAVEIPLEVVSLTIDLSIVDYNFLSVFLFIEEEPSYYYQNRPPPALLS